MHCAGFGSLKKLRASPRWGVCCLTVSVEHGCVLVVPAVGCCRRGRLPPCASCQVYPRGFAAKLGSTLHALIRTWSYWEDRGQCAKVANQQLMLFKYTGIKDVVSVLLHGVSVKTRLSRGDAPPGPGILSHFARENILHFVLGKPLLEYGDRFCLYLCRVAVRRGDLSTFHHQTSP